jgi:hypothetical protein
MGSPGEFFLSESKTSRRGRASLRAIAYATSHPEGCGCISPTMTQCSRRRKASFMAIAYATSHPEGCGCISPTMMQCSRRRKASLRALACATSHPEGCGYIAPSKLPKPCGLLELGGSPGSHAQARFHQRFCLTPTPSDPALRPASR